MISRIKLNNVASFKQETVLETDKRVNLIYGLNGVGKTTLSSFLYNQEKDRFAHCSVEGLEENDSVLVYNQDFIEDFFYESEGINGIFTLSKGNATINKEIEEANKKLEKLNKGKQSINTSIEKNLSDNKKNLTNYINNVWKIKTDYAGGDRVLEFCLDGLKGNKETLFNHLISLDSSEQQLDYSIEDLKKEAKSLQGDLHEKPLLNELTNIFSEIEESDLLSKVIVGNKKSTVSELIEKLNNSEWVSDGIKYVHFDGETTYCPFCQEKTITEDFLKKIEEFFDESYQQDKEKISDFNKQYKEKNELVMKNISGLFDNEYLQEKKDELNEISIKIKKVFENNEKLLMEKEKNPSHSVKLESFGEYAVEINDIIAKVNEKINEYNERIKDINGSKKTIKEKFWKLMRQEYSTVVDLYNTSKVNNEKEVSMLQKKVDEIQKEIDKTIAFISNKKKGTKNIEEAVININRGLVDIGITEFSIETYSEEEALYRLKRENEETSDSPNSSIFKSLSEGEKMVISFLYFIELCKGEETAERVTNNKIIVIDDPISSLSHIYVFNIGRIINNEFFKKDYFNQLFVLTHSLYFFYELTNKNSDKRRETQKLFRMYKNNDGSAIKKMKYHEIQNDYQSYWSVIKDKEQSPALIANCMRNIIEYFFSFVQKQDLWNVFQKPKLQGTKYQAFCRYMNRESHSDGENIFDIKEFDYDSFNEAFKQVFEIEGYIDHYNTMMKE